MPFALKFRFYFPEAPMASYSTNEFRGGLKIILDGEPFTIVENEFVKPGKGQAFNRVKVRNLKTGRVVDRTYKSGESVEAADVVEMNLQYLYSDGELWHFMDPSSFEQYGPAIWCEKSTTRSVERPFIVCCRSSAQTGLSRTGRCRIA